MSRMSRAQLLAWMNGKTKTLGWNSIVSYDRPKINKILGDAYVLKTGKGNIVAPMSGPVEALGGVVEISNLTLGNPLMSFYDSTLNDSKVNLQMPLTGGSFTTYEGADEEQYRVVEYNTIQPGDELFVDMTVSLNHTQGTVNEEGEVLLNLGSAVGWAVNFGDSVDVENALGIFIQNEYAQAPEENNKYVLGMIDINGNDPLTPESFAIRTQPEPDNDSGGGAVVMFIRTQADTGKPNGDLPEADSGFEYLIPNDLDANGEYKYSGSIIIDNETIIKEIMEPVFSNINGIPITFTYQNGGLTGSSGLVKADSAYIDKRDSEFPTQVRRIGTSTYSSPMSVSPIQIESTHLSLYPVSNYLKVSYPFNWAHSVFTQWGHEDGNYDQRTGSVTLNSSSWYNSAPNVKEGNVIQFEIYNSGGGYSVTGWEWMQDTPIDYQNYLDWEAMVKNKLGAALKAFTVAPIPGIEVMTLSNILFPGQDVLQLKDAALPFDLVSFGNINPALTSYILDPVQKIVVLNSSTTFVLQDVSGAAVSGAVWSVQAVNSGTTGSISTTGVYTAPASIDPGMTTHQDIVKAVFNGITSQSVVTVVSGMQVTPAFKKVTSYDPATPEERKVLLSATTLGNASDIRWEIELVDGVLGLGSLKAHADGSHKTWYIPPTEAAMGKKELTCTIIKAVDTATLQECRSSVLTHAEGDTLEVVTKHINEDATSDIHFPVLSSGQAVTMGLFLDGDENEYPQNFTWRVESGGGDFERAPPVVGSDEQEFARYVYRAPVDITESCAVITVSRNAEGMQLSGYAVIPLAR